MPALLKRMLVDPQGKQDAKEDHRQREQNDVDNLLSLPANLRGPPLITTISLFHR
jgi:ubiquinone biosynthesis protein Coq4